jgi:putative colanic acid biosynthesis acetyltransferase WcaF
MSSTVTRAPRQHVSDLPIDRPAEGGPSFGYGLRVRRVIWNLVWLCLAAWTPPPLSPWRVLLLKIFGATIHPEAAVAASVRIWLPRNLELGFGAALGPGVDCYNMAPIRIGARSIVSQRAFLCAGTHDINDERFPLRVRPINIGDDVWIASEAFVGPGINIGDGCVLGARGCAFEDLNEWTVYRGNPATVVKKRKFQQPVVGDGRIVG